MPSIRLFRFRRAAVAVENGFRIFTKAGSLEATANDNSSLSLLLKSGELAKSANSFFEANVSHAEASGTAPRHWLRLEFRDIELAI